ncbi:SAVED domain-containing protein [Streptomyces sp. ME02-6987-2C]|uniref:Hachiman antiphage defense system protein HamA n=1 Tax=unclassified Streptomyces TaxID=2593676 RepID=UPI0029AA5E8C|nr:MULTISPECIES: Hachiman antiphage defense system protein HamA [unclassified Streptomyces]MDX3365020.1 SAVED domain-containing protein [Streptomyces sp. ME02-6987-2C]MDX3420779.1 SAVED domain-containing protein [Streptomyces sp. ME02-6985-2c]
MFGKWLEPQQVEQPEGELHYEVLVESGKDDDETVMDQLGHDIARNYLNPNELALVFDDLGSPEVAAYLRANKFPADIKVRHGDFGEIVTAGLYRRVRRWCVPILKLRYKQTPGQAVQGTDVLAFRFRQTPPVIAVPEVKTRATRKRDLGKEAYDSLEKVLDRLDESLHFALARCSERNHQFLVRHLAALVRRPRDRVVERHMVFVHDALVWKEDVVELLADVVTRRTELTVVKIRDLKDFVARAYRAAETSAGPRRTENSKDTAA